MSSKELRKKGFTLVELLIVIAIIAILAGIAIPNYLEAQTRSKLSRCKADMRTLSIAIESYAVEYNSYPPDNQYDDLHKSSYVQRLKVLTSPTAYISSLPADPFIDIGTVQRFYEGLENPYAIPSQGGELVYPFTFGYECRLLPQGGYESDLIWSKITRHLNSTMWALISIGPDKIPTVLFDPATVAYDPTNGTISFGDVFWTGPGIGEDEPGNF